MLFWVEWRLEFPIYQAVLLCLSLFNLPLFTGVPRKELIFRMKNGRVRQDQWFLPSSCFPKILRHWMCSVTAWSQAGGASTKCPPLINHVLAIAAVSDLGAKAPALGTA